MTEDIAAKIREALRDPEHEDWCEVQVNGGCRPGYECFLGPRTRALQAVLDLCDLIEVTNYRPFAVEFRRIVAEALGISVSPLRGPNDPSVSGVQPRSGDQSAEEDAWLEADVRDEHARDAQTGYEGR